MVCGGGETGEAWYQGSAVGLADIEAAALTMARDVPGPAVLATAAAVGLSALLLASATAFTALMIAGACPPWAGAGSVAGPGRPDGLAAPR